MTVALGGASIILAIGATDAEHAFFSEEAGIDWNVVFLLLGMMLIVGELKRTGLRVPGDLERQEGPRPPVPDHGHPGVTAVVSACSS
ncbi:hypothetical protein AB0869_15245 [Micromonospora vinacea]|uniref:hypothetical protein n=1 Tax=Micromonospora vinacea TaxID=709878 RepID=UPI003455F99E